MSTLFPLIESVPFFFIFRCLLQEKWSENFNNFIASCLVKDATKRPTADDLLKHPFVSAHVGELSLTGRSVELASFVDEHLAAVSARRKKSGNNQVLCPLRLGDGVASGENSVALRG